MNLVRRNKPKNLIDEMNGSPTEFGDDANNNDLSNSRVPINTTKKKPENNILVVNKKFNISTYYEYESFPDQRGGLSWRKFTTPFEGLDLHTNQKIKDQCIADQNKLIDLRPYMVENPETITKFDFLPKILRRFINQHLRHLIVVNPITGLLEGMVTRQDIFEWLPL